MMVVVCVSKKQNNKTPLLARFAATLIHYLPVSLRKAVISLASHDTDEIKLVVERYLDYWTVRNILWMAADEVEKVRDLREEQIVVLREYAKCSFFIFSQCDHYVPLDYVDALKEKIQGLDVLIAPPDVEHAFVLGHSEWMADQIMQKLKVIK